MKEAKELIKIIIDGIQDKKGSGIVVADLTKIDGAVTDYFIICQGGAPSQVEAIAESVADFARKEAQEKPVNVNGLGNDQWIAIDFVNIMVHIFLPETRSFYDLENLWQDASLTHIKDLD